MSVKRASKDPAHPYTKVSNSFIYDCRLSLKAKALLLFVLSKPDSWVFNYRDVLRFNSDGIKSVRHAVRELVSLGYCVIRQNHRPNGDFEFSLYLFFEDSIKLSTFKTSTPAHSRFGHTLKGHTLKGHTLKRHTPNNKNKKLLRKETTTKPTKVVNTKKAVVNPPSRKQKSQALELFNFLGVINHRVLLSRYPILDLLKYATWMKENKPKYKYPTRFLVSAIKEQWDIDSPDIKKPGLRAFQPFCSSCGRAFDYLDFEPTRILCPRCEKKGK